MVLRIAILIFSIGSLGLATQTGCGGGATGGTSSSDTNSITGTVQAPTIGIFGNVAANPAKSVGQKALTNGAVANATVCAYNLISGAKLGCTTTRTAAGHTRSRGSHRPIS